MAGYSSFTEVTVSLQRALLVVPNHPLFYPHILRHALALRTRFPEVDVLAVFAPTDTLPELDGVHWYASAPRFAHGFLEFSLQMLRVAAHLLRHSYHSVEAVDPPSLIPAALTLLFRRTRLVYFSMEIFPDTPAIAYKPCKRWIWKILEFCAVRRTQATLTVNQSVAVHLQSALLLQKIGVVRSMPERLPALKPNGELRRRCCLGQDDFLLIYQGSLEQGRGLEFVCDCLRQRPDIHLAILGMGPLEAWAKERAAEQKNVHFCGAFPFERLMVLAKDANAGLVWIEPLSESYRLSLPGKIFEYTQSGIPMLGSPLPEIQSHIQRHGLGEVAAAWTGDALLQALDLLRERSCAYFYKTSLAQAKEDLCWEKEQAHLLEAFS